MLKSLSKERLAKAAENAAKATAGGNNDGSDDEFYDDEFTPVSSSPDIDNDDSFDEFTPV